VEVNPGRANSITGTEVFYGNGGGGAAPDQFGSDSPAAGSGGGGGRGSLGISGYNYGYFGRGGLPGTVIIRYSLPSAVEVVLEGIPSTATEGDQIDIVPSLSVECEGGTIDVTLVDPQGGTTAVTSGSIDTTGLAPGTYTVSVEYSGDDGCAPATASFPIVIQAPATTVPLELPATGTGSNGSMLMVALLLMTLGGGVVLIGRRAPSR
jgi:LPXTG-motif cell wall-anchored protein